MVDLVVFFLGLESGVEYYVVVNAENGVSHLAYPMSRKTGLINAATFTTRNITTNTGL